MPFNELDGKDDHGQQEHKNGNAVDAMHIFHPLRSWRIGVFFL